MWGVIACHQTDLIIREKIQDSIFSSAAKSVPVSRQSSGSCMILGLAGLPLELLFHRIGPKFLSSFFALPFVPTAFITGLNCREMPKFCAMISLRTTVFDSQNVNLETSFPQDFATSTSPEIEFFATEAFLSEDQNFDA
uniref:Uncharacterized protein n=1 Tax=Arundo donax TaxID=35708 RepID=A0A0A9CVW0_ARUDO